MTDIELPVRTDNRINLPELPGEVAGFSDAITSALQIPRDVLANQEDIKCAWGGLPRELRDVPSEYADQLAPMCVALSVGLFDSAINYIWNATVITLRQRVKDFGLPIVASIKGNAFEEKQLLALRDSDLLELCSELGILEEDAFFFLDQCRDVRNKCSAAHPAIGQINDREFLTYLNRCVRYVLSGRSIVQGVDVHAFIESIKGSKIDAEQVVFWVEQIKRTYPLQKRLLIETAYGIYCDKDSEEFARQNSIGVCKLLLGEFDSSIKSMLIDRHNAYRARGDSSRHKASSHFFELLGLVNLLDNTEQHAIVSAAVKRLWSVHLGMDNFYNEPPFAERLCAISKQGAIPETVQEEYVQVVVYCYLGNSYGVSWGAERFYAEMIASFSEKEIAIMLTRAQETGQASMGAMAKAHKDRFKRALGLLDENSIPVIVQEAYQGFLAD